MHHTAGSGDRERGPRYQPEKQKLNLKAKASKQADREPAAESSHDHEPRAGPTPGLVSFEFEDVYTLYYYSVYRTYGLQSECKG